MPLDSVVEQLPYHASLRTWFFFFFFFFFFFLAANFAVWCKGCAWSMGDIHLCKGSSHEQSSWSLGFTFLILRPICEKKFGYLATSLQVHVTTLYISEYLPFALAQWQTTSLLITTWGSLDWVKVSTLKFSKKIRPHDSYKTLSCFVAWVKRSWHLDPSCL